MESKHSQKLQEKQVCIYIPCENIKYGDARKVAENICQQIHELVPDITTTSVSTSHREDRVYVDPSQNDYADRLAASYCVRPHKHPTVSAPLEWKEVKDTLHPEQFTIHTMPEE